MNYFRVQLLAVQMAKTESGGNKGSWGGEN